MRPMSRKKHLNTAADYAALKIATRALQSGLGGVDGAASTTGLGRSTHGDYQNVSHETFVSLDTLYDMETVSSAGPVVTQTLARLHGKILVTAPVALGSGDMMRRVMALSKEGCEAVSRVNEAFNSGARITASEIRDLQLLRELDEAIEKMAEMRSVLAVIEEEEE